MIRDKRLGYALLAYLLGLLLLAIPRCARADEPQPAPCRQVEAQVICAAPDFERLVGLLLDARREAATCAARLQHCETKPEPVCVPAQAAITLPPAALTAEPKSLVKPVSAVALALTSGAALAAGALVEVNPTDRATLIGGGLLGIGLATMLAVW